MITIIDVQLGYDGVCMKARITKGCVTTSTNKEYIKCKIEENQHIDLRGSLTMCYC